ncbi:DUF1499 domain-containing protein [Endozoicomonas sp. YOMI1]|uniref:DUF1499 domain-containing protein n=1 Tax=Endozoicomonas sp. YOMI1 TaxID=2828739 RepID=UPI002147C5D5|nr:DUF1499 domain-containing protein [Endozoicomonas sp. YOMI1]
MKPSVRWLTYIQMLLLLAMVVGIVGYRSNVLPFSALSLTFAVSLAGLLLVSAISLGALPVAWVKRHGHLARHAVVAMVLGGLPLVALILMVGTSGFRVPRIHDISTDTVTPPEFVAAQQERSASENTLVYGGEALAAKQQQAYPHIQPYQSASDAQQTFGKALDTAQQLGWRVIREDAAGGVIEAVEETRVFGFKDDVIIRIIPLNSGSRVDVRSVSRVGLGDLGANANRIQRYLQALEVNLRG